MADFYQTGMGRTFYEGTMPRIAKALEAIAARLQADAAADAAREEQDVVRRDIVVEELRRQLQQTQCDMHALLRERQPASPEARERAFQATWRASDGAQRASDTGGPPPTALSVREAARRRMPLDGADAQALEHALTITECERDKALREVDEALKA